MKNQYVILTGSKNNAGDFLIKHRAKELFKELRPDRNILDLDRWKGLDENLNEINESKALILCGGPSLQKNIYPDVFKLVTNLDDIRIPIIAMGIGWHSKEGEWKNTYNYPFSDQGLNLLNRIEHSGYMSSVRDYHSLNVLQSTNFKNFLMTGCPAYYDKNYIENDIQTNKIKKVAFSTGVAFTQSKKMEELLKQNILQLKDFLKDASLEIVFHHSLKETEKKNVPRSIFRKQQELIEWLQLHDINFVDISGSADH